MCSYLHSWVKRLLTVFIFFLTLAAVIGQTERGTVLLSGELGGFSSAEYYNKTGDSSWTKEYSRINFLAAPKVGYFPAKNFLLGVEVLYGVDRYKFDNGNTYTAEQIGLIPFIRLYFPAKKFLPFAEVGGGIYNEFANSVIYNIDFMTKYQGYTYNAGAGAAFMVGNKVAIECRAGYQFLKNKRLDSNPLISQKNSGLFFRIGAAFYFIRK